MKFRILVIIFMLFVCSISFAETNYLVDKLELKGSKIMIIKPEKWNSKLLVIAHGFRLESSPTRVNIAIDQFTQELIDAGWMIAKTSYRRNGMIVRDAIEDLQFLNEYIEEKYGEANEKYLYGRSMGGKIAILIAESLDSGYNGVLALGAGMGSEDKEDPLKVNYKPKIPILFISNKTEIKKPLEYIVEVEDSKMRPFFWKIDRPGHCNNNALELKEAFFALLALCQGKEIQDNKTILHDMQSMIISEARIENNKIYVPLVEPSSSFHINIHREDFEKIGIEYKSYYELTYKDKSYYVYWGDTYSDVYYLSWVSFFTADGKCKLARNFGSSVSMLNYQAENEVIISRLAEQPDFEKMYNEEATNMGVKSWEALIAGKPLDAIKFAEKGLNIQPDAHWIKVNLLHGYLFSDQFSKAKELFLANVGISFKSKQGYFEQSVLEDFDTLKQQQIEHKDMEKIIELLKR